MKLRQFGYHRMTNRVDSEISGDVFCSGIGRILTQKRKSMNESILTKKIPKKDLTGFLPGQVFQYFPKTETIAQKR